MKTVDDMRAKSCNQCGGPVREIKSKFHPVFWGCRKFPSCDGKWLPKEGYDNYFKIWKEPYNPSLAKKVHPLQLVLEAFGINVPRSEWGYLQKEQGRKAEAWRKENPIVSYLMKELWEAHKDNGCEDCKCSLPSYPSERRQVHHIKECLTLEEYLDIRKETVMVLCRPCHIKRTYSIFQDLPLEELRKWVEKFNA